MCHYNLLPIHMLNAKTKLCYCYCQLTPQCVIVLKFEYRYFRYLNNIYQIEILDVVKIISSAVGGL